MIGYIRTRVFILPTDATRSQLEQQRAFKIWRRLSTFFYLTFFFCAAGAAWAGVGGSISGSITDPTGAAIAKAAITLVNPNTGVKQSVVADDHGSYRSPRLYPCLHLLSAKHS